MATFGRSRRNSRTAAGSTALARNQGSADPHDAGSAVADIGRGGLGELHMPQRGLRDAEKLASRARQCDPPGAAVEHTKTSYSFELTHELADRGRSQAQPLRGG